MAPSVTAKSFNEILDRFMIVKLESLLQIVQPSRSGCDDATGGANVVSDDDEDEALSDYENTPNRMELDRRANEVRSLSGMTGVACFISSKETCTREKHDSLFKVPIQKVYC